MATCAFAFGFAVESLLSNHIVYNLAFIGAQWFQVEIFAGGTHLLDGVEGYFGKLFPTLCTLTRNIENKTRTVAAGG